MIIIKHVGAGIGNQLNLLALYALLRRKHKDVKIQDHDSLIYSNDMKTMQLGLRNLKAEYDKSTNEDELVLKKKGAPTIKEEDVGAIMNIEGDAYVEGYFGLQWEGYDDEVIRDVRNMISYYPSNNMRNAEELKKIEENLSVSVHFRRTDYLLPDNQYLNIAGESYYITAINYILNKYNNPIFYFFSDDKEYINTFLEMNEYKSKLRYVVVDWNVGDEEIYDFQLMSKCKINVCPRSTFSAWAAALNEFPQKEVIRPLKNDDRVIPYLFRDYTFIDALTGEIVDKKDCKIMMPYGQ